MSKLQRESSSAHNRGRPLQFGLIRLVFFVVACALCFALIRWCWWWPLGAVAIGISVVVASVARRPAVSIPTLAFAVIFSVAQLAFDWLISAEASPLYNYFLFHVGLPNLWHKLNTPALVGGFLVSGNVHQPDELTARCVEFFHWLVIGYVLGASWRAIRFRLACPPPSAIDD